MWFTSGYTYTGSMCSECLCWWKRVMQKRREVTLPSGQLMLRWKVVPKPQDHGEGLFLGHALCLLWAIISSPACVILTPQLRGLSSLRLDLTGCCGRRRSEVGKPCAYEAFAWEWHMSLLLRFHWPQQVIRPCGSLAVRGCVRDSAWGE